MKLAYVECQGRRLLATPRDSYNPEGDLLDLSRAAASYAAARGLELKYTDSVVDFLTGEYSAPKARKQLVDFIEQHHLTDELTIAGPVRFLPPVPCPQKILAMGRNYAAHAAESNLSVPKEPIIFCKSPMSVIGHEDPVVIPPDTGRVDHEIELAVIIGKRGYRVNRTQAAQMIAGYTILNDVTARAMQSKDMAEAGPWFRSKSFDTFCPTGPWVVTPDDMPDPLHVDLELRVNDDVRQSSNTRYMIFDIPFVLEFITQWITMVPGDILSTGTPEGISEVHPGEVMSAKIQGIGTLRNPVKSLK
ncbi:MAG TPA: fumarylacetoacetate hydrolase family protein [bacterium]|nr:fumarylacetoacetate hydrolase family protein [bacterium]HQL63116.1 fumarylacetoacetate hydrolase family protein [bacterium]